MKFKARGSKYLYTYVAKPKRSQELVSLLKKSSKDLAIELTEIKTRRRVAVK